MMQAKSGARFRLRRKRLGSARQRHHLQVDEADDFSIRNLEELFAAQEASSKIMAMMLAAVARLARRGGIGIMNIMLISVRERTREIGLRQRWAPRLATFLRSFWSKL